MVNIFVYSCDLQFSVEIGSWTLTVVHKQILFCNVSIAVLCPSCLKKTVIEMFKLKFACEIPSTSKNQLLQTMVANMTLKESMQFCWQLCDGTGLLEARTQEETQLQQAG